jgi:galactose mutarotase-like enzyme
MSSYRTEQSEAGLELIRLQNDCVEIAIVPAAGGKILELIDRRTDRNWLWRNPHIPVSAARRDADFDSEQDSGGWDEILLSVKPGRIQTAGGSIEGIPDHGDLIGSQWAVDELSETPSGDVVCKLSAEGRSAAYRFERQIRLPADGSTVEIEYHLKNEGGEALPWYWCAHPLLAVESDVSIKIDGRMPLRIDDETTRKRADTDTEQFWPELLLRNGESLDLENSFVANVASRPFASKIFVRSPATGEVSVLLDGGESQLTFQFDPDVLPWFGIWINNGKWSGCGSEPYTNLGIEPATSPYDCVSQAIDNETVAWLAPGDERRWALSVELQG